MALLFNRNTCAREDYSLDMLPHTRREAAWDILKLHWKRFAIYGGLMLLITLPFHLVAFFQQLMVGQLLQGYAELSAEELREVQLQIYAWKNTAALFSVPCFLVLAIGMAGLCRMIRQYAWGENVFFSYDFPCGIKTNAVQMLLLGLLTGLFCFICSYCSNASGEVQSAAASVMSLLPVAVCLLIGLPVAGLTVVNISVYQNPFRTNLLLAVVLYMKTPMKTLFAVACCVSPVAFLLIPNVYVQWIGRLALTLVSPVLLLGWYSYVLAQLDIHVNPDHFPEITGKGLCPVVRK